MARQCSTPGADPQNTPACSGALKPARKKLVDLPPMRETRDQAKPSLLRHLTSMLYDALLVVALVFVVNAVALAALVQFSGGSQNVVGPTLSRVLFVACLVGFYSAFWLKSGQTLGMQAWRIKLVRIDGGGPRFAQAVIRCFAAALSAACLGLGYWWRIFDRNGRYWHDYLSGTELVLLPKRKRNEEDRG